MSEYWLYHDRAIKRARLHRSECSHCNNGRGHLTKPRVPGGETVWYPFNTLDAATRVIDALNYKDKGICKACLADTATDTSTELHHV